MGAKFNDEEMKYGRVDIGVSRMVRVRNINIRDELEVVRKR